MSVAIQIKGIRDGLLLTLGEGSWPEVEQALIAHLDQQADFLRGARIALDVGNQVLKAADLGHLRSEVSERGITLWAVLSDSPITIQTAQTLGLATRITKPQPELTPARLDTALHDGEPAVLLRRTLRSGFSVKSPGHIIVIGDVNPGAEVIAGGDILVWGRARGMLHAGAEGNTQSAIYALDLSPTQLRIAEKIFTTPQRRGKPQPEMAHLSDGQIIARPWEPKK